MRRSAILLPLFLVLAATACGAADEDVDVAGTTSNLSSESGSCSISREQILGSVSAARGEAITRGFKWFDDKVPYSQSAEHEGYRTDCSGFVSMCWDAGMPGETTASFPDSGKVTMLSSYDELVPGDALDAPGHHVVLFLGWNDSAKSGVCVIEQECTKCGMQFHVRSASSLKGEYKPMRAKKFAGDTAVNDSPGSAGSPSDGPSSADTPDEPAPTPTPKPKPKPNPNPTPITPTDPSGSPDPGGSACVPQTAQQACSTAFGLSGTECGTISDGCGGSVSCDTVPGLGCMAGETCIANQCKPAQTACVPKSAAAACAAAAASAGIECGMVDDGCGGAINCDSVPSFGCSGGATCTKANRCVKSDTPAPVSPNDPDSTSSKKNDPTGGTDVPIGKVEAQTGGEPGDDPPEAKSKTTPTSDKSAPSKKAASSGCSASASPVGGSGAGMSLLAFAFVAACLRRRRTEP
jgi:hypothetical protein